VQHGGGGPALDRDKSPCKRLFCFLQKVWQKKTTAGWIVRKPTKRPCKPRLDRLGDRCFDKLSSRQAQRSVKSADLEIRGGDFCRLGIVPAELHVINIQVKPSALNCSLKILIHWQWKTISIEQIWCFEWKKLAFYWHTLLKCTSKWKNMTYKL